MPSQMLSAFHGWNLAALVSECGAFACPVDCGVPAEELTATPLEHHQRDLALVEVANGEVFDGCPSEEPKAREVKGLEG